MPVGVMLNSMSSHELTEWMAYAGIEPFGEERADLRAGIISATVANRMRGKGEKAHKPQEFMPFREEAPADDGPSPDVLRRKFLSAAGGKG